MTELQFHIIYIALASTVLGWLVAFIGIAGLMGKSKEPWVGVAEQVMMTQLQKDKRVAEVYELIGDPKNRRWVFMTFGGMAWFVLHVIGIMVAAQTLTAKPAPASGRCILVQQEYAKPPVCSPHNLLD